MNTTNYQLVTADIDFEQKDLLNAGGEGRAEVWRVFDPQLGSDIAMKKIEISQFSNLLQYHREAQMLHQSRHDNIVPVYYSCRDKDFVYLAMPIIGGGSLQSRYKSVNAKTQEAVKHGLDILTGLHHIHSIRAPAPLIHFDIKPNNILLDLAGRAMLTDFGLSQYLDKTGFATPDEMYTAHMPPEWVKGERDLQVTSDIYQVGVTLWRLCIGAFEYARQHDAAKRSGIYQAILDGRFPDRKFFFPHTPRRLRKLIAKAMHPDPDKRFQSTIDMMHALSNVETMLDWMYKYNPSTRAHEWTKERDHMRDHVSLSLDTKTSMWSVVTTTENTKIDNTQRKVPMCSDGHADREKGLAFIGTFMDQL